ncbi:hypothetical protein GSI_13047 [Ganoderma sinense ZZ0214-1]|uniref:Nucleoside 2-deoxyribosyltransferase n=1 Tax=Ganoderma sinense ZZ0214-1 TaxID=1077348 RepID=A0A2G8RUZ6_9APHY|nr:hypothetical protein GSI_13047 [Ganoderma sinense ZZ0214-1]
MAHTRATIYNAPEAITTIKGRSVFLSGSILTGDNDWRKKIIHRLEHLSITFFNPVRVDWDDTWKNSKSDSRFCAQVKWELDAQERADVVAVYLDARSPSPISLLELGLALSRGAESKKVVVYCQDGFEGKGNVEIVCERHDTLLVTTFEEFVEGVTRLSICT